MSLSESAVSAQVRSFMEAHGWRSIRMQRTVIPGMFQTAEPGCPDFLFLRYNESGSAYALWCEIKSPTDRRSCRCLQNRGTRKRCTVCDQKQWQEREKARGARLVVVDDFDWFADQYERAYGWLHKGETARGQMELI